MLIIVLQCFTYHLPKARPCRSFLATRAPFWAGSGPYHRDQPDVNHPKKAVWSVSRSKVLENSIDVRIWQDLDMIHQDYWWFSWYRKTMSTKSSRSQHDIFTLQVPQDLHWPNRQKRLVSSGYPWCEGLVWRIWGYGDITYAKWEWPGIRACFRKCRKSI